MSHLSVRGEQSTEDEILALSNLASLAPSASGEFIRKTTLTTFENATPALGGGSSSGHTIQDEGTSLTSRTYLNFVGAGVTVTDDSGTGSTIVSIGAGSYTDEQAQDAVGSMVNATLTYTDVTPLLSINLSSANTWLADQSVPDEAYGAGWNGSVEVPTKNALYDKIETISAGTQSYARTFLVMGC